MAPSDIKVGCVYDYKPNAKGPWPCVLVTAISKRNLVEFQWLEEDGGTGRASLSKFARHTKSRRHKRTWKPIAP